MNNICQVCGTSLINGICPICNKNLYYANNTNVNQTINIPQQQNNNFKCFFISPNEELVTTLGNTYIQNYLSNGSLSKGFAIVSDKRAYFQGTIYEVITNSGGRKSIRKTQKARTVDLKDITGTGYDRFSNPVFAVLRILWIILSPIISIPACIDAANYLPLLWIPIIYVVLIFLERINLRTMINIQFAGGEIAFNNTWFSKAEIDDFQRLLRLAKDKSFETSEGTMANKLKDALTHNANVQPVYSKADEISKYANLLSMGYISQEEFDNFKKGLL